MFQGQHQFAPRLLVKHRGPPTLPWARCRQTAVALGNIVVRVAGQRHTTTVANVSGNKGRVTDMELMFAIDSDFNQPLGSWDVSRVTTMSNMFNGAKSFNQDIDAW